MIGTVLTQKCGDDWLIVGTNVANVSADVIARKYLISKERYNFVE